MKKSIYKIFEDHRGLVRSSTLMEEGVSPYGLKKLIEEGKVEKVSWGLYHWTELEVEEIRIAANQIPEGVLCLDSAAYFHDLTVFIPPAYRFAIPRKKKYVLPEYPAIKLMYWGERRLSLGIMDSADSPGCKVYDHEKTICDLIYYQTSIGLELVKEVVKNYLGSPGKNLHTVVRYARELKQEKEVVEIISLLS